MTLHRRYFLKTSVVLWAVSTAAIRIYSKHTIIAKEPTAG